MSEIDDDDEFANAYSLFRALEEKGKYIGRTNILQSVILVGKISPHITDHLAIGKYYDSLAHSFSSPDHITGLLMIYPYHVIHIIESSFRTLLKIFRAIDKSDKIIEWYMESHTERINLNLSEEEDRKPFSGFDRQTIQEMCRKYALAPTIHNRILCSLDNVVHRIFRTYEVLVLDMEATVISDYDSNETDEKKLLDLLSQVTRLSVHLAEEPMKGQEEYVPEIFRRKLAEILGNIRQVHPELIPQQAVVGYFADVSSYEGLISIKEYMNIYDLPYETSLQSELAWPVQKNSFFYT
uniref:Uncharacterized protein n=2 Tax=Trichobilharzia regenti TaxID=157069 RepID=A0AA85K7H6_TRIRE|nr:unnamed protein product [Trichobilharzia regenti]